jgi:hypothetical protein
VALAVEVLSPVAEALTPPIVAVDLRRRPVPPLGYESEVLKPPMAAWFWNSTFSSPLLGTRQSWWPSASRAAQYSPPLSPGVKTGRFGGRCVQRFVGFGCNARIDSVVRHPNADHLVMPPFTSTGAAAVSAAKAAPKEGLVRGICGSLTRRMVRGRSARVGRQTRCRAGAGFFRSQLAFEAV